MITRFLLAVGLAILMVVSGTTSYVYLSSRQSKAVAAPQKPTDPTPRAQQLTLPGTIYLAQSGALYSFSAGRFHQLTAEAGWTQPALFPDGSQLLAVKRSGLFSDVYVLTRFGNVTNQLTSNQAPVRSRWDTGANAWSFYPRLSPDQGTLYMSYDGPKAAGDGNFNVLMQVWGIPRGGTIRQGRSWTLANNYTGGDMQPVPLPTGGLIYTKYSYDSNSNRVGQLWYTNRAGSAGKALTSQAANCSQLWWLPKARYAPPPPPVPSPTPGGPHNGPLPTPSPTAVPTPPVVKPIQLTTNLGFDATSPLAWSG